MRGSKEQERLTGLRQARLGALAAVAIIVGAVMARGDAGIAHGGVPGASQSASSPAASPMPHVASSAAAASDEVAPITIVGTEMKFAPAKLTIPAHTDVTIIFVNRGVIPHNIRINELGIDIDIKPRQQATIVINAPPGTYRYSCDLPGHSLGGMRGTLTVT